MDALYLRLIDELNALGPLYIHVVDHSTLGAPEVSSELKAKIRAAFNGIGSVRPLDSETCR